MHENYRLCESLTVKDSPERARLIPVAASDPGFGHAWQMKGKGRKLLIFGAFMGELPFARESRANQ